MSRIYQFLSTVENKHILEVLDGSQESEILDELRPVCGFVTSRILSSSGILESARGLKILDTAGEIRRKRTAE